MKTRSWQIGLFVLLIALFGLGIYFALNEPMSQKDAPPESTQADLEPCLPSDFKPGWKTGFRYLYDFSLRQDSDTRPLMLGAKANGNQGLTAKVDLQGQVQIDTVLLPPAAKSQLRFRILTLSKHSLIVAHTELLDENTLSKLKESALIVQQAKDGSILRVQAGADNHENLTRLMHLLLNTWQMHLQPGQSRWSKEEQDQHGLLRRNYKVVSVDTKILSLARNAQTYLHLNGLAPAQQLQQNLSARSRLELSPLGHLQNFVLRQKLKVHDAQMLPRLSSTIDSQLRLIARQPQKGQVLKQKFDPGQALMDFADASALEQQALRMRIAGMNAEIMLGDLNKHRMGSRMPDHNRWLWRATGLLTMQAELCAQVASYAQRGDIDHEMRGLALDLLVGAGTKAAQHALIDALSKPMLRHHPRYSMYLQRSSLVKHPDEELVDFVQDRYQNGVDEEHTAAAYALGSVANHLDQDGDRSQAEQVSQPLQQALNDSADPAQQAHLIRALGNAGLLRDMPLIISYARSAAPQVRQAVAEALRKMIAPQASHCLVGLGLDPQASVAAVAFVSLKQHSITDADLTRIDASLQADRIAPRALQNLLSLLQPMVTSRSLARQIIEHMTQLLNLDAALLARARGILQQGVNYNENN